MLKNHIYNAYKIVVYIIIIITNIIILRHYKIIIYFKIIVIYIKNYFTLYKKSNKLIIC